MGAGNAATLFAAAIAAFVVACGGGFDSPSAGGDQKSATATYGGAAVDRVPHPSSGLVPFPAAHAPLPIVDYNGGPIIAAPQIVTIDFDGDHLDPAIQGFAQRVGSTSWWGQVTEGYCATTLAGQCVGPATAFAHVTLPLMSESQMNEGFYDATITDVTPVKVWLRDQIANGLVPPPTDQTIYMIFFPVGFELTLDQGGVSCMRGGFAGYHNSLTLDSADGIGKIVVPYAALPRCATDAANLTRAASHELIEAATDPHLLNEGYVLRDQLWSVVGGGEVADLCVDQDFKTDTIVEAGLTLQRSWSNLAVQAGTNPCVPVPEGEIYFNTTPAVQEMTLGQGESVRIELASFSDAPGDDWTVDVFDLANLALGDSPYLKFEVERRTVNNGTRQYLAVTALRAAPITFGAPFLIVSRNADHTHIWPATVHGKTLLSD